MKYEEYAKEVLFLRPWNEFGLPRSGKVLEIGSGDGWGMSALRSLGLDPVGLDICTKAPGLVCGTATHLPFHSRVFDGVVCVRTLHHIRDDREVLTEAARVVRSGGFLFLAVANRLSYTLLSLRLRLRIAIPNKQDPFYRLYSRGTLRSLLWRIGFEIQNFRPCHFFPRLLSKVVDPKFVDKLAAWDASLGVNTMIGRFGPLLLVHGVKV